MSNGRVISPSSKETIISAHTQSIIRAMQLKPFLAQIFCRFIGTNQNYAREKLVLIERVSTTNHGQ